MLHCFIMPMFSKENLLKHFGRVFSFKHYYILNLKKGWYFTCSDRLNLNLFIRYQFWSQKTLNIKICLVGHKVQGSKVTVTSCTEQSQRTYWKGWPSPFTHSLLAEAWMRLTFTIGVEDAPAEFNIKEQTHSTLRSL